MPWLLKVGRGLPSVYDYDKRVGGCEREKKKTSRNYDKEARQYKDTEKKIRKDESGRKC